ncbi:MFS transporter [Gordonia rhizosphera]|uniref:Putative major facilitator superfamily transporter n=1 Tax=Gordonia rhizosphera NBRC 16068 TaxID=1108045 RepID=K6WUD8_9ACTN|nr:MFS transporter [Gordonia rhizosphera]GAB90169.1 putative major facilitator superfamily transporter [Gordonia rhizosphera NBRC 16068]
MSNTPVSPSAPAASGNPRAAQDPRKRRFLIKLSAVIAGGMFIDGFILGGIGLVMPSLSDDLGLSATWQGLIGASALIGIFFGGPIGGLLADKVGRKPMFTVDLAIFLIGSVAQFFVGEAWQLFVIRFVMGLAIGADYAIGWPMLAEFSPARIRGKLLAFQEVAWYIGYLVSYAVGYFMLSSLHLDWRLILGMSTVPSLIVFLMRLGTPESPRWLISKGRAEEGHAIAEEFMEPEEAAEMHQEAQRSAGFMALFSKANRRATAFTSLYWACNVTPYFAIATFAPIVLESLGVQDGLAGALLLNSVVVAGAVAAMFLIERVGRRMLAIPPMWIGSVALVIIGLFAHVSPLIILTCFVVFSFANAVSTALTGVFPGEVFPTEVRGAGVGFATAVSRIGAAAGTFILPLAVDGLGVGTTMLIAAAICAVGAVIAYYLAPETKGVSLHAVSVPHVAVDRSAPEPNRLSAVIAD